MAKQTAETRVNKSSKCPNCGERRLVPIVYGYPSEFTMQLSLRGTLELGGCIISGDDPSLRCGNCHHNIWRDGRTSDPDERHRRGPDSG
jgi:DNA-directed RNA polymerase subunit RPC12/RpoP